MKKSSDYAISDPKWNLTDEDYEMGDRFTPYFYRQSLVSSYKRFSNCLPKPLIGPNNQALLAYLDDAAKKGFSFIKLIRLRNISTRNEKVPLFQPLRFELEIRSNISTDPFTETSDCEFWIHVSNDHAIIYRPFPHSVCKKELDAAKLEWLKQYQYLVAHLGSAIQNTAYELCHEMTGVNSCNMNSSAFREMSGNPESVYSSLVIQHLSNLDKRLTGLSKLYVGSNKKKMRYSTAEMLLLINLYDKWLAVFKKARKVQLSYRGDDWRAAVLKACPDLSTLPPSSVGHLAFEPGLAEMMELLKETHKPNEGLTSLRHNVELDEYLSIRERKVINAEVLDWLGEKKEDAKRKAYKWKPMHIAYVYSARCVNMYQRNAESVFPDMPQWTTIKREVEAFKKDYPTG